MASNPKPPTLSPRITGAGVLWPNGDGPWKVTPVFTPQDGRLHCVAISVAWAPGGAEDPWRADTEPIPSEPVASVLRHLPTASLIERSLTSVDLIENLDAAAAHLVRKEHQRREREQESRIRRQDRERRLLEQVEELQQRLLKSEAAAESQPPTRPGRRPKPMTHYRKVAELYRHAVAEKHPAPRKKVAEELGVHAMTVARDLMRARKLGILGPARRGQAGEEEAPEGPRSPTVSPTVRAVPPPP
jgi:hypothetical protein